MFWIRVLYQMCLPHFLLVFGLSSHSFDNIFHRQNILILVRSSLLFLSVIDCTKSLPNLRSTGFCPHVSCRSFCGFAIYV
jgi:hypothetical protein